VDKYVDNSKHLGITMIKNHMLKLQNMNKSLLGLGSLLTAGAIFGSFAFVGLFLVLPAGIHLSYQIKNS